MKPISNILITLLVCLTWSACSSDRNDDFNELAFAPESIYGKNLRFSASSDISKWFIDIYPTANGLTTVAPEKSWKVENPYCAYTKVDDNKAKFSLEYVLYTEDMTVLHVYELVLLFTSEHGGTYEGLHEYEMNGIELSERCSGSFAFDTGDVPPPSEEDKDEGEILLSTPTVSNIATSSVHIEGNIVATDVSVQEQGICYGTIPLPTLNDNYKKSATSNISIDLEGLTENTSYNVRLYAKVDGKVKYGKTAQFTTKEENKDEEKASTIKAVITKYELNCNTQEQTITFHGERGEIAQDKTLSVGFCASTSPEPNITDISFPEATIKPYNNSGDRALKGANPSTTYYIRPYHVADGKVIYYEGTSGQTICGDVKMGITFDSTSSKELNGSIIQYEDVKVTCSYEIALGGTYKVTFKRYSPGMINPGPFETHVGYVEKGKHEYVYSAGIAYNHTFYTLQIESVETGMTYEARLGN